MGKYLFICLILIMVLTGCQNPADFPINQEPMLDKSLYTGQLSLDPVNLTIQGILRYNVPNLSKDGTIVFNVYGNAYKKGINGSFFYEEFKERIFPFGYSEGFANVNYIFVNGLPANFEIEDTKLKVKTDRRISKNNNFVIDMDFHYKIPKIAHRSGANNYSLWLGNWLPILSVYKDGKWHTNRYHPAGEPFYSKVSDYDLTFQLPSDFTLVATGREDTITDDGNIKVIHVKAFNVREMAIAASNSFRKKSTFPRSDLVINFYGYDFNDKIVEELLKELGDMIAFFEGEVGPYPYEELDIIQNDFFIGGMEYPQFIMLSERTLRDYNTSRRILIHELAHQWFYGIIGNNEALESWFDEGVTTFNQNRYLFSQKELHDFYRNERQVLKTLLKDSNNKLGQPLELYSSWNEYFLVNYRKAALMQYELLQIMGEERYRTLLQSLYERYKFKEVDRYQFFDLASEVHGSSLKYFLQEWF
jgi:hypothetical protein